MKLCIKEIDEKIKKIKKSVRKIKKKCNCNLSMEENLQILKKG